MTEMQHDERLVQRVQAAREHVRIQMMIEMQSSARSCARPGYRMVVEFHHDEKSHDRVFL